MNKCIRCRAEVPEGTGKLETHWECGCTNWFCDGCLRVESGVVPPHWENPIGHARLLSFPGNKLLSHVDWRIAYGRQHVLDGGRYRGMGKVPCPTGPYLYDSEGKRLTDDGVQYMLTETSSLIKLLADGDTDEDQLEDEP